MLLSAPIYALVGLRVYLTWIYPQSQRGDFVEFTNRIVEEPCSDAEHIGSVNGQHANTANECLNYCQDITNCDYALWYRKKKVCHLCDLHDREDSSERRMSFSHNTVDTTSFCNDCEPVFVKYDDIKLKSDCSRAEVLSITSNVPSHAMCLEQCQGNKECNYATYNTASDICTTCNVNNRQHAWITQEQANVVSYCSVCVDDAHGESNKDGDNFMKMSNGNNGIGVFLIPSGIILGIILFCLVKRKHNQANRDLQRTVPTCIRDDDNCSECSSVDLEVAHVIVRKASNATAVFDIADYQLADNMYVSSSTESDKSTSSIPKIATTEATCISTGISTGDDGYSMLELGIRR